MNYDGYSDVMQAQISQVNQEERRFTAAVAAMQGLMASPTTSVHADVLMIARDAVKQADALLEELAK
jgi:hypothetical protein